MIKSTFLYLIFGCFTIFPIFLGNNILSQIKTNIPVDKSARRDSLQYILNEINRYKESKINESIEEIKVLTNNTATQKNNLKIIDKGLSCVMDSIGYTYIIEEDTVYKVFLFRKNKVWLHNKIHKIINKQNKQNDKRKH